MAQRTRFTRRISCAAVWLCLAAQSSTLQADDSRPNIVHIFADDLGWGSVGFNGQTLIATPNLDALAASGMRLTNAYAAPVCAPSRATLYTGFHQGHAGVDGNNALNDGGFGADDVMTGQMLAPTGYNTSVFGKWGFGASGARSLNGSDPFPSITDVNSLPTNHGFETFYGYLSHGAAHDYFYDWMWRSDSGAAIGVVTEANNGGPGGSPQYSHDLFADQSEQYVAAHAGDSSPFYMQLNYTIPHWDIDAIANAAGGYGQYANLPWTSKQKAYAAMISRMDASIGSLIDRLDDPNADGNNSDSILANTLVLITSDNGPTVEDDTPTDFFDANGVFRGGKFEIYEGGIHMPALAYWPGTIAAGSTSDYRTDLADFMATAADLAGAEAPVGIDGTSILPTLTGQGRQHEREYLVFEHQGAHGADPDPRIGRWAIVRQDGMKLIHYDNGSEELFDLNSDPGEASPLNLNVGTYALIADELRSAARSETVLRGVVEYRTYTGPSGGNLQSAANWNGNGRPNEYWSATVINNSASSQIAHVTADVTTLGLEVRGVSAEQVVNIHAGSTLTGHNEVRVSANGRVDLSGGTLASNRWVNVRAGGEIRGHGAIVGDVTNEGTISPGQRDDDPAWPIDPPPALPPLTLDTGNVTATFFDFNGVQDDVPLVATSTQSHYIEVANGLNFGPGVDPRLGNGGTDAGNEFNISGHTGTSLNEAIAGGDYVSFTVDPIAGAGVIPSSISFRVWRNGGAAAKNFAILSSIDGFSSGDALAQASYTDTGMSSQHTLTASFPTMAAVADPIEFRLYGWGGTVATGNTHLNLVSLNGRFLAVPTLEFNFTGVQNDAPLTSLKRQDAGVTLTSGLDFGPGLVPAGSGNASDAFNVTGFSTGSTLQSAIEGDDLLTFTVQPVQGLAMYPDSVSFTMWRDGAGSATAYAVMSSVDGFSVGQQLAQTQETSIGASNQFTLTGLFEDALPTTAPVEFRLYGWNAATTLDSTHLTAASMRARFASVADASLNPAGQLIIEGDFEHLAGGVLDIDLGGTTGGVDYDVVSVLGSVQLEGGLDVSLLHDDGVEFSPDFGDIFEILTAAGGITGEFAEVSLPQLTDGLEWFVDYSTSAVTLDVLASADFNRDGAVDAMDLELWEAGAGITAGADKHDGDATNDGIVDGRDYLIWQRQFNMGFSSSFPGSQAVPEPDGLSWAVPLAFLIGCITRRREPNRQRLEMG